MKTFISWFIFFAIVGLCGCTKNSNDPGKIINCPTICQQHFQQCKISCVDNCTNCSSNAQRQAAQNYHYYLHEQYVQGAAVARDLQSYRDLLQCRKVTCNCIADYKNCRQGCTSIVYK